MQAFGKSQGGKRREDQRFVTGTGRYVADIAPVGAAVGVFLRSPVAHGRITTLDVAAARAMPGVLGVFTARDLPGSLQGAIYAVKARDDTGRTGAAPARPVLASQSLRHVGEAVALIVAQTHAAAVAAMEAVILDIDELEPVLALSGAGPQIHPEAPGNLAFTWARGDGDAVARAFERAAHVTRIEVVQNRVTAASLEPRAAFAEWHDGRLHLCFNGQGVWTMKRELARMLDLSPEQVRVTNPDVGGGFGMKAMVYPEHFALSHAARALGCAVLWVSERGEAMVSDNGGRDLVSTAELAFDEEARILGYRVRTRANMGAHNSQFGQNIQSELFSKVLTGVYRIPCALLEVEGVYTNTTPVDAYRGAGRPEAITALERAMDMAARELGLSPFEIRRRNFLAPSEFPATTPMGVTYDIGDFEPVLARAALRADVDGFPARRAASADAGRLRGLGVSYYIEAILGEDSEAAAVEFAGERVQLLVGTQSNGQGHETVFAQYLADLTGLDPARIDVVQGDSDLIARGGGTGGSRSVTVQSLATHALALRMVEGFASFLSGELGAEFGFDEGIFSAPGSNTRLTLAEAVDLARARGRTDLLRHEARAKLPGRSFPNGCHICEVEIDPQTGALSLDRYLAVDDFGNLMHPVLAEGQVHGGVAQGFGQAVMENMVFDPSGQLLSGSFMDYAMPRAADLPVFGFENLPTPSPNNPLGMKGCGEAGTVAALAAISNAALDALWPCGVRRVDMPLTPLRIWQALADASARPRQTPD